MPKDAPVRLLKRTHDGGVSMCLFTRPGDRLRADFSRRQKRIGREPLMSTSMLCTDSPVPQCHI